MLSLENAEARRMITGFSGSSRNYIKACTRSFANARPFLAEKSYFPLEDWIRYDRNKESPRSNTKEYIYSYGYEEHATAYSDMIRIINRCHQQEMEKILGPRYRVNNVRFWRNLYIPAELQSRDIYSNVFHQDIVCDQCCIQYLINLHNVSDCDGPFEWVNKRDHRVAHKAFKDRKKSAPSLPGLRVEKLTGPRGSSVLINAAYHYHRDGIPAQKSERTIMSIAFFPEWTRIGSPIHDIIKHEG